MVEPLPNIWQFQSQRDVTRLIAALAHPDPDIRRRAAVALRTLGATEAVSALTAALAHESNIGVRVSLRVTIQVLGAKDPRADAVDSAWRHDARDLLQALEGPNPEQTIAAAYALGESGDRLAVEPLIILFHDVSALPAVRLAAAEALLALQSAPADATLLAALHSKSWQTRYNAAAVLGQMEASWAVAPLEACLNDRNPLVRRAATTALRRITAAADTAASQSPRTLADPHMGIPQHPQPQAAPLTDSADEITVGEAEPLTEEDQRSRLRLLERPVNRLITFLKPRE